MHTCVCACFIRHFPCLSKQDKWKKKKAFIVLTSNSNFNFIRRHLNSSLSPLPLTFSPDHFLTLLCTHSSLFLYRYYHSHYYFLSSQLQKIKKIFKVHYISTLFIFAPPSEKKILQKTWCIFWSSYHLYSFFINVFSLFSCNLRAHKATLFIVRKYIHGCNKWDDDSWLIQYTWIPFPQKEIKYMEKYIHSDSHSLLIFQCEWQGSPVIFSLLLPYQQWYKSTTGNYFRYFLFSFAILMKKIHCRNFSKRNMRR